MVLTLQPPPSTPTRPPEPQNTASRCRHSLDLTPPASSNDDEDRTEDLHTKSPHMRRIVKQGHKHTPKAEILENLDPNMYTKYPLTNSPPSLTPIRPTGGAPTSLLSPTLPPLPSLPDDVAMGQLKHLESLLDLVLATLVIIQSTSTTQPIMFSTHTQQALQVLNRLLPTAHKKAPSPAGPKVRLRTRQRILNQPHRQGNRLVVRWPDHPVPNTLASLSNFIDYLETQFQIPQTGIVPDPCSKFAGANVTISGSIVIYTKSPFAATRILDGLSPHDFLVLRRAVAHSRIPDFTPDTSIVPVVELDVPWYGIVVHNIPAEPLREALSTASGMWTELESRTGLLQKDIRDLQLLCSDKGQEEKEHISMRIMTEDPCMHNMFTREPFFIFGTRCRVSRYRPSKRCRSAPPSIPTSQPNL
ncbi:hypothetical protein CVT25_002137 [Psilocybe cyanescens]|uniref:Uncharacterized protein n=1 Tax=Psilocybe cyanescens TaxID=93625 RepID=A0A409X0D7_PSICY|nr:hypothetical protein CVT25_002137 [Psilocybe cyanescens]